MKYLCIHKVIWFVLVLTYTLFESLMIGLGYTLYVIWNFRIPRNSNIWKRFHTCDNRYDNHWDGNEYSDDNIVDTIIRRYNCWN